MDYGDIIAEKDKIINQLLLDKSLLESKIKSEFIPKLEVTIKENERLVRRVEDLQSKYHQLIDIIYNKKSEKKAPINTNDATQPPLFGSFEKQEKEKEKEKEETQTITYQRRKNNNKKPARLVIPDDLRREDHIISPKGDLSNMVKVGESITEKIAFRESELYVKRYIVEKYRPKTPNKDGKYEFRSGKLPSSPIEKGIPDPSLLSHIIVSKFVDHLPVYRQAKMFERQGCNLPTSTIYGWLSAVGRVLEPLYDELKNTLLSTTYIMADETPIPVQDNDKKNSTHRGWQWVYYSPLKGLVCFEYRKGRAREGPKEFLSHFNGYLQTDGYKGYEVFDRYKDIQLLGCMAHARRKFIEAEKQDPKRAEWMLKNMQTLYGIEKICRDKKFDAHKIKKTRERYSKPILIRIKAWLEQEYQSVTPKSSIGKAIAYTLKRWKKLSLYICDGKLKIDNNLVENQIRPVALGRKNYLFAGSHQSAKHIALYYSLLGSCKQKGINPKEYFTKVLTHFCKINLAP